MLPRPLNQTLTGSLPEASCWRLEGAHGERLGQLHEIYILVDDVKASQLTYAHGTWRLRGYFVAAGIAGIWQGVTVHNLTPIPLAAVAE
jgi:hypothetical protein